MKAEEAKEKAEDERGKAKEVEKKFVAMAANEKV